MFTFFYDEESIFSFFRDICYNALIYQYWKRGNNMSLIIKLREAKNFTPNEIGAAKYIISHSDEVIRLSCTELAKKTYTSPATIIRLCKKIGIGGYQEFKVILATEINFFIKNSMEINKNNEIDKKDSISDIIDKISSLSIDSLKETKILTDKNVVKSVIDMINNAEILDLYGSGASHFVALDANYKFMRIGKVTATYALYDQQYVQAKNSNENHAAIIFSYSGETAEMIEIAKILTENKAKIITFTKNSDNTLEKFADKSLYVTAKENLYRSAAIYSRISMLNVIDILYTAYFNLIYEKALEALGKTRISKTEVKL